MTVPIITPAQFGAMLPKVAARLTPEQITDLVGRVSDKIRRYCGWHVTPVLTRDLVLDGSGSGTLMLPTLNLEEVVAVSVSGLILDPVSLEFSRNGYVRRPGGWPDRLGSVQVTIRDGIEEAGDVVQVLLDVIERAVSTPTGVSQEATGANSLAYIGAAGLQFMGTELDTLNLYRVR